VAVAAIEPVEATNGVGQSEALFIAYLESKAPSLLPMESTHSSLLAINKTVAGSGCWIGTVRGGAIHRGAEPLRCNIIDDRTKVSLFIFCYIPDGRARIWCLGLGHARIWSPRLLLARIYNFWGYF
jgi:hypothetical protein